MHNTDQCTAGHSV